MRFHFPPKKWLILWTLILLFELLTHTSMNSPYLYSTKGEHHYYQDTYGMELGPRGEVIHHDAVNYWSVEQVFSGNYRGAHLSTINRPFYPMLAAILDTYVDKVYAGWIINIVAALIASIFGYSLCYHYTRCHMTALFFGSCLCLYPGLVNVIGQPMGYVTGYSLYIIFMAVYLRFDQYTLFPRTYLFGVGVLASLASLTYELLVPILTCTVLFASWKNLTFKHTCFLASIPIAVHLAWKGVAYLVLSRFSLPASDIPLHTSQYAMPVSFSTTSIGYLFYGPLLAAGFVPAILAMFAYIQMDSKTRDLFAKIFGALFFTFILLVLLDSFTGHFGYYKEGRVIAYYAPMMYLILAIGLKRLFVNPIYLYTSLVFLFSLVFILSNLDIFGWPQLYLAFGFKPGYVPW